MTENGNLHYAIVGTGAVGGYYGGLLAHAGKSVHFLLNTDYSHVTKHGLRVDSPNGDFHLKKVNTYHNVKNMPPCDVIIIALKTTHNHLLPAILPPLMAHKDTLVLTLQNGLGIEEEIATLVGANRVIGGLCFLCSNKTGPGYITHLDYGKIIMGDYYQKRSPETISKRLSILANDLNSAGIQAQTARDILKERWKKLVWNVPYNGLCTLFQTTTDKLMRHAPMKLLIRDLMKEVVLAAKSCGAIIDNKFTDEMLQTTEQMAAYKPSMLLDYEKKVELELETIYHRPIQKAAKNGFQMKKTEVIYQQLLFLNNY
ncbi:MAG: putative 2-dehydropantoate 2-reductase [Fibrobacteria bacterium]|nr:putative 2-dehydropantoate 2-reductase [Fibrobacteria bacterium]